LNDVRDLYGKTFRPERTTLVVVGDVSPKALEEELLPAFGSYVGVGKAALGPPALPEIASRRTVVVVDRPDAPQSVVALVLPGLAASVPDAPILSRANVALGGSFTSRLNQDLREERGITYGASSRLSFARGPGMFVAQASVETSKTGEATKALLADVAAYATDGPTSEEAEKTRLVGRADLVEGYEGVASAAARLARLAGIGEAPDYEAKSAKLRDGTTLETLKKVARERLDPARGAIVIVGPKDKVLPQIEPLGLGPIELMVVE
jgi:predicted Zn-dependent peptidase